MRPPVTMATIAKLCGVSRPAVSMALAGKPGEVSDETRARIVQKAQELGYRPNSGALAVRTGRFQALALLLDRASYLPHDLLHGLNRACAARGLHLVIAEADTADLELAGGTKLLDHLLADGILINWGNLPAPSVLARLAACPVPVRWLNQRLGSNCVHPDDVAGSRALVEGLVQLGHRRIAFSGLLGGGNEHFSWADRVAGYRAGMAAHGLQELFHHATDEIRDGGGRIRSAREFLTRHQRPTAIICYSGMALYSYHLAALELGLRVPTDLSLAAHVEGHHTDLTGLRPGGVAVPWQAVAEAAVAAITATARRSRPDTAVAPAAFFSGATCAGAPP